MKQSIKYLLIVVFLSSCSKSDPVIDTGAQVPEGRGAINLEQGWSAEIQEKSWFTSFGSRWVRYDWLMHLEQADSAELFKNTPHLESFGLLGTDASELNPDRLAVGMTHDIDEQGIKWAGLGCAACHTGQVIIKGQKVRLDGGAAMFDFQAFESALIEALSATVAEEQKFERFASSVEQSYKTRGELRDALVERTQHLRNVQQVNAAPVAYGPGRLDAFGQIFNAVGVQFLADSSNRHVPDAPVSFPILWSAPHLDLVQWNGSAPNSGPGPLFQNITTALAVYGNLEVEGHGGKLGYPSSVHFSNLGKIQEWLYQLKPPQWPQELLGEPDATRVARGAKLYQKACLACHALTDRNDPKRKIKVVLTPLNEIGTDPQMVQNFLSAKAFSGPFAGQKLAMFAGPVIEKQAQSIDLVIHAATGAAIRHPLQSAGSALTGYHKVYKAQIDQHPNYYKARSLDGVWASAPYLHNGSVPTLADLLLVPEQRPVLFKVGSQQFDEHRVGVDVTAKEGVVFDTNEPGNRNSGHTYGTEMDEQQKADLLEYLKTL